MLAAEQKHVHVQTSWVGICYKSAAEFYDSAGIADEITALNKEYLDAKSKEKFPQTVGCKSAAAAAGMHADIMHHFLRCVILTFCCMIFSYSFKKNPCFFLR